MLFSQPEAWMDLNQPWVKRVSEYFDVRTGTPFPQPLGSFFVCEKQKMMYAPIAKCACTSVKSLMVQLSCIPNLEVILENGVHRVTDAFVTGAQLRDYSYETARDMLCSDDYYKFSVIRDPVMRVVSAYTEKFLLNRTNQGNLIHTLDVVRDVRRKSTPDLQAGISFREFVEYLLACEPAELDSHWMPQSLLLVGVNRYNAIFTMNQMAQLASSLSDWVGHDVELAKYNASVSSGPLEKTSGSGHLSDVLPQELDQLSDIASVDFIAPDLREKLEDYYQADVALYRSADAGLSDYVPPAFDFDAPSADAIRSPLTKKSEIARCVGLYSKGYFALDKTGRGEAQVLILNTRQYTLDFSRVPSCSLAYIVSDASGNVVCDSVRQAVSPGRVEAGGFASASISFQVPAHLIDRASSLKISLHLGEAFDIEEISPLHVTVSHRIG